MNDMRDWPKDLPLFRTELDAERARPRPDVDPAEELARLKVAAGLGEHLDSALAGSSSPRVWLLLHEPGQTHLAALAALEFAAVLSGRELAAFVLDGDDRTTTLSSWFGRDATEGWIDLVRYGASVLTAGTALPGDGRTAYLLGVGSYAPTDVSPEETADLVARLRRQADDVLVVAPVDTAELWGRLADIRLLCLDRARRSGADVVSLCKHLESVGAAPTGLIAWGRAAAPEQEAPPADPEPVDEVPVPSDPAEVAEAVPPRESAEDAPATPGSSEEPGRRAGSTSGVFWFAAVAAVVIILAVGAYYLRYLKAPADETTRPTEPVATMTLPLPTTSPDTTTMAAATDEPDTVPTPAVVVADTARTLPAPEPAGEPDTTPAIARPVFDPAPYQVPVGEAGWALHLYSFPDSAAAAEEVAILAGRGLMSDIRVVEIAGKGRYHRIYVGSFADRASAREAMPALLERLRADWANPVRFGTVQR